MPVVIRKHHRQITWCWLATQADTGGKKHEPMRLVVVAPVTWLTVTPVAYPSTMAISFWMPVQPRYTPAMSPP